MTSKRKPVRILPSAEYLRACFNFDHQSGTLFWKERPRDHFPSHRGWRIFNAKCAGKIAGTPHSSGYIQCKVAPEIYLAHRIIFKLVTGQEPSESLDHIDGNRRNNSWSNLRDGATFYEAAWNSTGHRDSESGFRGVFRARRRWEARIMTNGVTLRLGYFATPEAASAAYEAAARKLHGKFYRPR